MLYLKVRVKVRVRVRVRVRDEVSVPRQKSCSPHRTLFRGASNTSPPSEHPLLPLLPQLDLGPVTLVAELSP